MLVLVELAAPRQMLVERLRRAGHAPVAVGAAAAALDHLHRVPCDALVAGFRPPAPAMLGLARTIRALPPPLGRLPVIGVVPTVTQQATRDGLGAGLDLLLAEAPGAGEEGLTEGLARLAAWRWGPGPLAAQARAALAAGLTAEALEARDTAAIRLAGDLATALWEGRPAGSVAAAAEAAADALAAIGAREAVDAARALAAAPARRNALLPPLLSALVALRVALRRDREARLATARGAG